MRSGGVAVYVNCALPCRRIHLLDPSTTDFEHLCLEIKPYRLGSKILFIVTYHPPNSRVTTPTRVTRCSAALLNHVYVTHPEQIIESLVPMYGQTDHYPVCFVDRSRGPKSPKSHHDTIKFGASRILTRIVLFTIYTPLHGRCLTCLKMQMTSWTPGN